MRAMDTKKTERIKSRENEPGHTCENSSSENYSREGQHRGGNPSPYEETKFPNLTHNT